MTFSFPSSCKCGETKTFTIRESVPSDYAQDEPTQPSGETIHEGLSISEPTRVKRVPRGLMTSEQMRCRYIDGNSNQRCEARSKGPAYKFRCPEHM